MWLSYPHVPTPVLVAVATLAAVLVMVILSWWFGLVLLAAVYVALIVAAW